MVAITITKHTLRTLVWLATGLLVLLAVYCVIGRQLIPYASHYQKEFENTLSQAMNTQVRIDRVQGSWSGIAPIITLERITIASNDPAIDPNTSAITIKSIRLQPDIMGILLHQEVRFKDVLVDQLVTIFNQMPDGQWRIKGLKADKPPPTLGQVVEFLLNNRRFNFLNPYIEFKPYQQEAYVLDDAQIRLERRFGGMRALGKIRLPYQRSKMDPVNAPYVNWMLKGQGDPKFFEQFSFKAYARIDPSSVSNYLPDAKPSDQFKITDLRMGSETWLDIELGQIKEIKSQLTIPQLGLAKRVDIDPSTTLNPQAPSWTPLPPLRALTSEIQITQHPDRDDWQIWVDNLDFYFGSQHWQPEQMRIKFNTKEKNIYLEHDGLDIGVVIDSLVDSQLVNDQTANALSELSPRGFLKDIKFYLQPDKKDQATENQTAPNYRLTAQLSNVSIEARNGSPQVQGINAQLMLLPGQGMLDLSSRDLSLHFKNLFDKAWSFENTKGRLFFRANPTDGLTIKTQNLRLYHPLNELVVDLNLALPPDKDLHAMGLAVGILNTNLAKKSQLLPNTLDSELSEYLDRALDQGVIKDGAFLFNGNLAPEAPEISKTLEMYAHFDQSTLDYSPQAPNPDPVWPKLEQANIHLLIDENGIAAWLDSAQIYDTIVKNTALSMPFVNGKASYLAIKGATFGSVNDGINFINNTPLATTTNNVLQTWKASQGQVTTELDITLGFDESVPSNTQIKADVFEADVNLSNIKLEVAKITGPLILNNDGLSAENINLKLFAQPAVLSINTKRKKSGKNTEQVALEIALTGSATTNQLYQWSQQPLLTLADGKTNFKAQLNLVNKQTKTEQGIVSSVVEQALIVNSDLKGIGIELPGALKKLPQEKALFDMRLNFGAPQQILTLNYNNIVKGLLLVDQGKLVKGDVAINRGDANLPVQPGLQIRANLASIDLNAWQSVLNALQSKNKSTNDENIINRIAVDTGQLVAFGQELEDVRSIITRLNESYLITVKSPRLNGSVLLPDDRSTPLDIELDNFILAKTQAKLSDQGDFSAFDKPDPLANLNPQTLPPMNVAIQNLKLSNEDFGSWSFELRPNALGAKLRALRANVKALNVSDSEDKNGAILDWYYLDQRHSTRLEGVTYGNNMADVLTSFGNAPSIESASFTAAHSLEWEGSPAAFDIARLRGNINLDISRGQFVEIKSAANALQVIGVFDFTALTRRLRLDFADIAPGGFNFDKIKGNFILDEGILINRSLVIENPSSTFQMVGSVDLIGQQVDQELIVTLPVSRNLPWYALLGGPQLAAGVFVAGQIFRSQIEQFSSARYSVIGPFEKLNVEFVKIFNNQFEQSPFVEGSLEQ